MRNLLSADRILTIAASIDRRDSASKNGTERLSRDRDD